MNPSDKLRIRYSKREDDIVYHHPAGSMTSSDAGMLAHRMQPIIDELERRGYDPKTLRFSIEPQQGNERFQVFQKNER